MANTYRPYSRMANIEENKNKRTAMIFVVLTIGLLLFLGIFGFTLLSKAAVFLSDINSVDQPIDDSDMTPPASPLLGNMPEYTSSERITVQGSTEADASVRVSVNNKNKDIIADTNGSFTTEVTLQKGENTIYAVAIDKAGNESNQSRKYTVNFDTEKPNIEITKPKDGDKFYGKSQKQITVEGKTDIGASVTINDRIVILDSEGKFKFAANLGDGENTFNIKSTDQAGNQTELTIAVTYTP